MKFKMSPIIFTLLFAGQLANASMLKSISSRNIRPTFKDKTIALTFDDGPTPKTTRAVLKVLWKYNVPATFFVIGKNVESHPRIVEEAFNAGHIIANHSYSHKYLGKISWWKFTKTLKKEFFGAHEVIAPYLGNSNSYYYRAPGASWKERGAKYINKTEIGKNYIGPVLWDIGGETHRTSTGKYIQAADWQCWSKGLNVDECLEGYLGRTAKMRGGIVLMHDVNMKTAQMLKQYIPALLKQGYTFVSLEEMNLKK